MRVIPPGRAHSLYFFAQGGSRSCDADRRSPRPLQCAAHRLKIIETPEEHASLRPSSHHALHPRGLREPFAPFRPPSLQGAGAPSFAATSRNPP